jgi:uncharacterized membrane protein
MTALIELAYVVYWFRTFYPALESAEVYKQRLWVTAGMIAVLSVAGHLSSKELGAVVSGWAIAIELASVVLNVMNLDDRLFPRKETY